MEFNCYDVLEVQGSRYVITEKIKYAALIGGVRGVQRARALGGTRLDRVQYAGGYAIAFGLAGTIVGVCIARLFEL